MIILSFQFCTVISFREFRNCEGPFNIAAHDNLEEGGRGRGAPPQFHTTTSLHHWRIAEQRVLFNCPGCLREPPGRSSLWICRAPQASRPPNSFWCRGAVHFFARPILLGLRAQGMNLGARVGRPLVIDGRSQWHGQSWQASRKTKRNEEGEEE